MKLSKKTSVAAIAATMFVSPLALMASHVTPSSTVQAATSLKGKIEFTKGFNNPYIYNKDGKAYAKQPTDIDFNKPTRYYGQPVVLRGPKNYDDAFPFTMPRAIIKGEEYVDLGDGGYIKWSNMSGFTPKKGKIGVLRNSYVYNKDGKRLSTYRGQKAYFKKDSEVEYVGKRYIYLPNSYLNIGDGNYINTDVVNNMDGKGVLKLNTNSYVYNKYGKRTTYNGKSVLGKYDLVNYSGRKRNKAKSDDYYYTNLNGTKQYSVKNYKINGQDYYYLGQGAYIKAINVGVINGHPVFRDGGSTYVAPKTDVFIYNSDFKQTKKSVAGGKEIKVDATTTTGEGDATQRWFRIAGTKGKKAQWLLWGDNSTYGDLVSEHWGYLNIRTRI